MAIYRKERGWAMSNVKGIILAGGHGTRLLPITTVVPKQLLPIYDKPMIYYPISVLMLAGIQDILIICKPNDRFNFETLLGDGSRFGVNFSYCVQENPNGLAEAFILGEDFVSKGARTALILGDNIFYGQNFTGLLKEATEKKDGATIFGYQVMDPSRYGVVEVDKNLHPIKIEEKPDSPRSNIAVTGLYFYDEEVVEIAKSIAPSSRGELEISDINEKYLEKNKLEVNILGRGFTWLDTGTHDSLIEASHFVETIENSQGFKIACLEEIAIKKKWVDSESIEKSIHYYGNTKYGEYLKKLLNKTY
jgi:glucose-1-phosphate thymidylyltransferase